MKHCLAVAFFVTSMMVFSEFAAAQPGPAAPPANEASRKLHQLFDERYRWQLEENPQEAMSKGDYSNAHRLMDTSLSAIERRHRTTGEHLARLKVIDTSMLSEADLVSYELFELELRQSLESHRFRTFLAPISGRRGPQQSIPQMAERVRFNSALDYENYLKRLEQTPKLVDDTIERMKLGVREGRTTPRVALEKLPGQFDAALEPDGLKALAEPFDKFPASIGEPERAALRKRFDAVSLPAARSAIAKLGEYVIREYIPSARASIAAIDWPEGEEFYNFQLRVMTTTDLTAREIHEIGLKEVARIRAEMMSVIRSSDFMSIHPGASSLKDDELFKAFIHYLRTDPRFYHTSEEALLVGYRDICKRVDAGLPRLFKTLPRLPYGVKEIPSFMAPTQTTAYYQSGDIRNAEAGYFMANTYDLSQRPKYEMIPLAMHEAVPGHHLQVALAQELENMPEFRKDAWFTAFGEGWALYSERLGLEMDLFNDPYDDFGRLLYEMWRACRLVVDPGMHALAWSRDKAVRFMLDNTALSELNINTEIDRYIAWPGQACGYKIGEIRIRELRARAEKDLGAKFDIREFHDVVLGAGNIPLSVLERRVNDWISNTESTQE